jgi:hypothetical protein
MLLSFALCVASLAQTQVVDQAESDRHDRLQFLKQKVVDLVLSRPDGEEPFPLRAEAVLLYSNPEKETGTSDGATFLWLDGKRPVAAVSFSIRRPENRAYRELTSFSAKPLVCGRPGTPSWTPKGGGLLNQSLAGAGLAGAGPPAEGSTQRLVQMRSLARRFSADCYHHQTDTPNPLRLLTSPLYRFEDAENGIIDGALFGYVVSTDPELFLLLEAVRDAQENTARWRYSLARMSSLKQAVRLDNTEIWSVPNYHRDPQEDRKTGPYTEAAVGRYVAGVNELQPKSPLEQ